MHALPSLSNSGATAENAAKAPFFSPRCLPGEKNSQSPAPRAALLSAGAAGTIARPTGDTVMRGMSYGLVAQAAWRQGVLSPARRDCPQMSRTHRFLRPPPARWGQHALPCSPCCPSARASSSEPCSKSTVGATCPKPSPPASPLRSPSASSSRPNPPRFPPHSIIVPALDVQYPHIHPLYTPCIPPLNPV
jgi:hypothetical protein